MSNSGFRSYWIFETGVCQHCNNWFIFPRHSCFKGQLVIQTWQTSSCWVCTRTLAILTGTKGSNISSHLITLDTALLKIYGEQGGDIKASNLNWDALRLIDTFMIKELLLVNKSWTMSCKGTALLHSAAEVTCCILPLSEHMDHQKRLPG